MKPMSVDAKGGAFAFLNLDDAGGPIEVKHFVITNHNCLWFVFV